MKLHQSQRAETAAGEGGSHLTLYSLTHTSHTVTQTSSDESASAQQLKLNLIKQFVFVEEQ